MGMAPRRILVFVLPLLLLAATVLATTAAWRDGRDQSRSAARTEAQRAAADASV